jgi:predicted metal-dependent HD superfamily phosphohydrolase
VILIDPPAWPAHGRLWSHLVSDTSLHELRTFARAAGLPDRGFDLDHYDVPDSRHAGLVAAGATPVDGGTLARRQGASGLRVPGRERAGATRTALGERWARLARPSRTAPDGLAAWAAVGDDLITRWREPHRVYHGRLHLTATLDALNGLLAAGGLDGRAARTARLAVWFHDAVHDGVADRDEERSADLAVDLLSTLPDAASLPRADVADVARLVLLTAGHDPEDGDPLGAVVSDADLAVLGVDPPRYTRYTQQVRAEYGHVPDEAFRIGRGKVLEQLLGLPTLYRTPQARDRWSAQAATNLRVELATLGG